MSERQQKPTTKPAGLLQDDSGNTSSMRVMSLGAILLAIVFSGKELFGAEGMENPELIAYLVAAALGGKSLQKIGESLKKP